MTDNDAADYIEPTDADFTTTLRLARIYLYSGGEPYAPAVTPIASMLAAHRVEVTAHVMAATGSVVAQLQKDLDRARTDLADLVRKHNEVLGELHAARDKADGYRPSFE